MKEMLCRAVSADTSSHRICPRSFPVSSADTKSFRLSEPQLMRRESSVRPSDWPDKDVLLQRKTSDVEVRVSRAPKASAFQAVCSPPSASSSALHPSERAAWREPGRSGARNESLRSDRDNDVWALAGLRRPPSWGS
eukprot:scaffold1509_cov240-Pinguiococcus_pyrenoidosus.AAC.14